MISFSAIYTGNLSNVVNHFISFEQKPLPNTYTLTYHMHCHNLIKRVLSK